MVLVINNVQRGKPNVNLDRAVKQFGRQIGRERIFVMPFDNHIFEGRQITLELLSAKTRRRYLELAARVSELFPRLAD
jgi:MinD-like ATPase involved in chromosome partitioning or flagellar assembly